jgi:hypothetical protein
MSRWVREFLDDQNQGLDHLIEYLSFRLVMMRHEQRISESRNSSEERLAGTAGGSSGPGILFWNFCTDLIVICKNDLYEEWEFYVGIHLTH